MTLETHRQTSETIGRILEEVAAETDVEIVELPPIYEVIDPDALESLLDSERAGSVRVEFSYYGYDVHVTSDGGLSIDSPESVNG